MVSRCHGFEAVEQAGGAGRGEPCMEIGQGGGRQVTHNFPYMHAAFRSCVLSVFALYYMTLGHFGAFAALPGLGRCVTVPAL